LGVLEIAKDLIKLGYRKIEGENHEYIVGSIRKHYADALVGYKCIDHTFNNSISHKHYIVSPTQSQNETL